MSLHLLYRKAISTVCIFGQVSPNTEKKLLISWGKFQLPLISFSLNYRVKMSIHSNYFDES